MKFRLLGDRVIVKDIEAEVRAAGGSGITSDFAREKAQQEDVIAVIPASRHEACP
jgi:co-chaperonin GroES (HSP10)